MYDEILFHGTEVERGEKILKWKRMFISEGDRHWLGDGSYFYEDDFYAYKWIKDMYKRRYKQYPSPPKNLFREYKILRSRVKTHKNRVFDLDKPRNKIEFDRVHENCKKKQKYSMKFSNIEMAEGVVLNIMFNDMWYSKEYDVVVATFKRMNNKYFGIPMRLDFMPEKQVCVKNLDKAIPIDFYECEDKIDEFQYCINNLYEVSELEQTRTNSKVLTYNTNRRSNIQRIIKKNKKSV